MKVKIEARTSQPCRTSAEGIYDAWLDPAKVRVWLAASLQAAGLAGDVRRIEIDAREGGRFFFSDLRGDVEARHWGTYLALDRPRRIAFTWLVDESEETDPSTVTMTIEPMEAGCAVTVVHEMDAAWAEYVARTESGWARMVQASDAPGV